MSRKYPNPPIVETLCEFQFVPGQPWDLTVPGSFYGKIKDEFPRKRDQISMGLPQFEEAGRTQRVGINPRMQFLREDEVALVQIGPDLFVVNHLKPYPAWETFKPLILRNLEVYREIASPKGFKRVFLRYVNKIELEGDTIQISDYFKYHPLVPDGLRTPYGAFNVRVEIPCEDERDILTLALANAIPEKQGCSSMMFDLGYALVKPERVSLDQVDNWIEGAHTTIENAFEVCITDKCRNLFEETK